MKSLLIITFSVLLTSYFFSCQKKYLSLATSNLTFVNREPISIDKGVSNTISLDNKMGDGLAILKKTKFTSGAIELDFKGENAPGRSFVGLAFNIQDDSTYEAVYFRPFNFQSQDETRRNHSIQYISHPKNTWRYLRTKYEGQYEANFPRKPDPKDWFGVKIVIQKDSVFVYDRPTQALLLRVKRIAEPASQKIGLWTGNNSKGQFRNLMISK